MKGMAGLFDPYPIGTVIDDRYRIVGVLGRGGMGIVYAADDLRLANKLRAIKVIAPIPGNGRYAEEAQMLMRISHQHLPLIVDYYPPSEHGFEALVMEYIEGHTIAELYRTKSAILTFAQIMEIALQLCSALRYLHANDPPIIHRDLKPSNVMIDSKRKVKLIDFGISRQYKLGKEQDTDRLGTLGFAAPEQAGKGQSDEKTDIYGFGALLFFMASGGMIYRYNEGNIDSRDPIGHLSRNIPNPFKKMLRCLLQSDPRMRYRSMQEVEEALAPFAQSQGFNEEMKLIADHNPYYGQHFVCLLSLAPGSGATFITHALANLLASGQDSVTAAEYEHARPEWHAWLSGNKRLSENANVVQDHYALDLRYERYKLDQASLNWFALKPEHRSDIRHDDHRFEQMLRQAGASINLIDISGKWTEPRAWQLMKQATLVIVVGDPAVVKWQRSELRKLVDLKNELESTNARLLFIANKDIAFYGRTEWLHLFPGRPVAIVPKLPEETMLSLQWRGLWATDDKRLNKSLKLALSPILKLLYNEMNTG
ncbi:serine/threonine-protein kinase [Paenibacillus sp. LPE1-1-1.1]|uniref:serine/threonine-protein kinase n=1 Tax=Paenibacillus sp. LPE1-1-1.1 TaxID=3135230 RepID=UPI003420AAD8